MSFNEKLEGILLYFPQEKQEWEPKDRNQIREDKN